ncbi:MAG TPA: SRPBCC family protein [Pyrinomonadaceae bacterium]|nr:SRPBCC family protein [Pyrinomonadaceae bacterium]
MKETHLTQETIDHGSDGGMKAKEDFLSKAGSHPILAGGAILIGAGLAYVAAKVIATSLEENEVAREVHLETSIAINKSPADLYNYWRDFRNLPRFMKNLDSVTEIEPGKTHWVAKAMDGVKVEWDAEIYNEIENELIAWRSVADADVVNAGSVRFQAGPEGHGTYVRIAMNYNPPAGKVGIGIAYLLGAEPSQLIKEDLRRFKQIIETGEIATIEGQPSGRVSSAQAVTAG